MINSLLKNLTCKQFVCRKLDGKWKYIYKYYFKVIHILVFTWHDICPLFMRLLLFTFIAGIDQMIFVKEHLWGTASAITKNTGLTNENICKIISKNIS